MTYIGSSDTDAKFRNIEAGFEQVDVPQVRNLTVEDWESGTLDTDVWSGAVSDWQVVDDPASSGRGKVLKADTESYLLSLTGLKTYPQRGDSFTIPVYFTDTDQQLIYNFFVQDSGGRGTGLPQANNSYYVLAGSTNSRISFTKREDGNTINLGEVSVNWSNYLNQWVEIKVTTAESGEISVSAVGESISVTDETWSSGGIRIGVEHGGDDIVYHDSVPLKRRVGEYTSETKKGTTELGNEVLPSGSIHTGAQESSTNALRAEYARAPVTDSATAGDKSMLTLLKSGVNPAMYMERTLDGQGGAYGHQLQAPLGRFARINANLSWEYNTLADVPNWETAQSGGNYTFNVNSRPRRIQVSHDGSGGTEYGGVNADVLTSYQTLGAFRITFHGVRYTQNNTDNSYYLAISDQTPDNRLDTSGNGLVIHEQDSGDSLIAHSVNSGTRGDFLGSVNPDWSQGPHTISLEYDGSTFSYYFNGVEVNSKPVSVSAPFRLAFQVEDDIGNTASETFEVEQVTIEPLPEVLQ